jgi:RNA polymerase sigma factor (sigma-70 family)
VAPHREHMLAVARRRCASEEDAEDCVQEAMLRVAQFDRLDPARTVALLTSVVARLAVDMHRRRSREQRYQPRLAEAPEQQAPPDEAVLDAGEAQWLASQLPLLPERERAVFTQRAAGYTASETAARLGLTYKSVESAFTRARGRMRIWAGAGVLFVAEYLHRLRTRSATTWEALALISAGCLVLSTGPVPAHAPAGSARIVLSPAPALTWHGLAPLAAGVVGRSSTPARYAPQVPRSSSTVGADRPALAGTWHDVYHAEAPLPGHDTTVGVGQSTTPGTFSDALAACISQTAAAMQRLDTRSAGCPS